MVAKTIMAFDNYRCVILPIPTSIIPKAKGKLPKDFSLTNYFKISMNTNKTPL
uniref:Uncharacterized protein n=1 Tax=Anguilla anguilla TaxID=7936 RepID=A0A0E9R020_ANGAN